MNCQHSSNSKWITASPRYILEDFDRRQGHIKEWQARSHSEFFRGPILGIEQANALLECQARWMLAQMYFL